MKTILLIHGPNLNLLGQRNANLYGNFTLAELENVIKQEARMLGMKVIARQSNHEGELIDFLQQHGKKADGIIINPGALAHYSYALHDALLDAPAPAVEVHLSNIAKREKWRAVSVTAPACRKIIGGKKIQGYLEALRYLHKLKK